MALNGQALRRPKTHSKQSCALSSLGGRGMSAKLPVVSSRELIRVLSKCGFSELADRGKGSHHFLTREDPPTSITIPRRSELPRGTLRAILRSADLSADELRRML
ncbi:type II toxin-antitoxin system HicA family toxin [Pirellulimonas nuda]|uniref:type II toxin-antitoxin system HicA family toxin n=1 Tax=Pirellulimonas nuda TaxID=2528009 RepID=UPI00119EA57F